MSRKILKKTQYRCPICGTTLDLVEEVSDEGCMDTFFVCHKCPAEFDGEELIESEKHIRDRNHGSDS